MVTDTNPDTNPDTANEWSERDQTLIHLLSLGQPKKTAAEAVGVSRETVSRLWHDNLKFRTAVLQPA
jgi:hypothetical protein